VSGDLNWSRSFGCFVRGLLFLVGREGDCASTLFKPLRGVEEGVLVVEEEKEESPTFRNNAEEFAPPPSPPAPLSLFSWKLKGLYCSLGGVESAAALSAAWAEVPPFFFWLSGVLNSPPRPNLSRRVGEDG